MLKKLFKRSKKVTSTPAPAPTPEPVKPVIISLTQEEADELGIETIDSMKRHYEQQHLDSLVKTEVAMICEEALNKQRVKFREILIKMLRSVEQ